MASSRGRERLRQRQLSGGPSYAFGSSTPRDLSYMKQVPRQYRHYDSKIPIENASKGPDIIDYMRQARSLTPSGSERGGWAFGSSTPRDLSHITGVPKTMRVYDAPIDTKKTLIMTRSVTADPPRQRMPMPFITRRTQEEEDVSSEPDLVQDRTNFFDEVRKKQQQQRQENAEQGKTKEGTERASTKPPNPRAITSARSTTSSISEKTSTPMKQQQSMSARPSSRESTPESQRKKRIQQRSPSPPLKSASPSPLIDTKVESQKPTSNGNVMKGVIDDFGGGIMATVVKTKTNLETAVGETKIVVQDAATELPRASRKLAIDVEKKEDDLLQTIVGTVDETVHKVHTKTNELADKVVETTTDSTDSLKETTSNAAEQVDAVTELLFSKVNKVVEHIEGTVNSSLNVAKEDVRDAVNSFQNAADRSEADMKIHGGDVAPSSAQR